MEQVEQTGQAGISITEEMVKAGVREVEAFAAVWHGDRSDAIELVTYVLAAALRDHGSETIQVASIIDALRKQWLLSPLGCSQW